MHLLPYSAANWVSADLGTLFYDNLSYGKDWRKDNIYRQRTLAMTLLIIFSRIFKFYIYVYIYSFPSSADKLFATCFIPNKIKIQKFFQLRDIYLEFFKISNYNVKVP